MWNNVIGQHRVKKILQNALEHQRLPSAYLFHGPEGTGKDAAAIELAKAINCLSPIAAGTEACDECVNCLLIASFNSELITFVHALAKDAEPSGSAIKEEELEVLREQLAAKAADPYHNIDIPRAHAIQIGHIRELRLSLSRSISGGKMRIVIISEADMMNAQAQNAFLKTLEEPHRNTLIILTSSNPNRFYPTILSRCQEVRFDVLTVDEIATAFIEREEITDDQAYFLARLAGGSYSNARNMSGDNIQEMRKEIIAFLRMGLSKSRRNAAMEIDRFLPRGSGGSFLEKRHAVEQRLLLLTLWLRDALALSTNAEEQLFNLDQQEDLRKFVTRFGVPSKIIAAIRAVENAQKLVRMQVQLRPVMLGLVAELELALL